MVNIFLRACLSSLPIAPKLSMRRLHQSVSISRSSISHSTQIRVKPFGATFSKRGGAAVDTDDEDGKDDLDFVKLVSYELNGRQIRSVCRMAGALARDKQQKIDQQTLELTIKYAGTTCRTRAINADKKKKIMMGNDGK